jgi:primosomal protein N' (replication factor Y)
LLPLPLAGVLDYGVPESVAVLPGDIVLVTLNGRRQIGVVWDGQSGLDIPAHRIKPILGHAAPFQLDHALRHFVAWVAAYTLAPPGEVLAMVLRQQVLTPEPASVGLRAAVDPGPLRSTAARQRVMQVLGDRVLPARTIARLAGVSSQLIRGMARAGWLQPAQIEHAATPATPDEYNSSCLSPEQSPCAQALRTAVEGAGGSVTLLQGATGSGKTEVYFEAVRACLAAGRQALVLLPEIALSAQFLSRFKQRFGFDCAVWHSDIAPRIKRRTWRAAASGMLSVVVGARSALFLPLPKLGLIVVDEEHDSSFKQEDGVVYHARDMAVVRGRLANAAVILVSATPSLETLANVEARRYTRLELPSRFGGASLPKVAALDLRQHPPDRGGFLSPLLLDSIRQTLDRGEQAMLFLNRRGFAPLTLCRACGHRIQCPNCTAWLVEHRLRRHLLCHHCGHTQAVPTACPSCSAEASLTAIGPGVERITEEIAAHFPAARRLVMASDTLIGPNAAAAAAATIEERKVDIVIGTQVVAKGWHFPHLTLVGVVDADLGLAGGDLRAGERTLQLLHQVAGRAGRAQAAGAVLLQTYQPAHPVISALVAGDLDGFMRAEADQRRPGHWPPYGRLAALIVSAEAAEDADAAARALGRAAPQGDGVMVLGPAPAPLALLRGRHRRRLLLRTHKDVAVQPLLRHWIAQVSIPARVRIDVDVDPVSFL